MRRRPRQSLVHVLSVSLSLALAPTLTAQTVTNTFGVDCTGLKLVEASGLPDGATHSYRFYGICKLQKVQISHDDASKSRSTAGTAWMDLESRWDASDGRLLELAVVKPASASGWPNGKFGGSIRMELRCSADPVITPTPCGHVGYSNSTGWLGYDEDYWAVSRPISSGRTTLVEASAISKPAPKVPPPPPPSWSGTTSVELESIAGSAQSTQGGVGVQDMKGFGSAWSAGKQLFWGPSRNGAQLRLRLISNLSGNYEVTLSHTKAPDYGLIDISLNGQNPVRFSGFAPSVSLGKIVLGTFHLEPGGIDIVLSVKGRDATSSGYYAGLDRLEFRPVTRPD